MSEKSKPLTIADLDISERTRRGLQSVAVKTIQDCILLLAGKYKLPDPSEYFHHYDIKDKNAFVPIIDRIKRFGPQGKEDLISALRKLGLEVNQMEGVCHGCGGSVPLKPERVHVRNYCNSCHRVLLSVEETQPFIQVALDICHEKGLFKKYRNMTVPEFAKKEDSKG